MKNINPNRWIQIESILDQALDLDPADRQAYVLNAAGTDNELASQVMKMLEASQDAHTFLESGGGEQLQDALVNMASVTAEEEEEDILPGQIGPYRLIKRLGRGGMGEVYLATKDSQAFTHQVALKVIRKGMDTDDILTRFRMERQILASLVHPGIARLLDGGATEDGLPYFVMEYVDGIPLTKYCDENRLSLTERLVLFERVASAVHYAHQNLIVHRDLKPGNILVTAEGEVKLLDFGIAKFLDPDSMGFTTPVTRTEVRVMTPEYASPEQISGAAITTASDVYQLGILLYELLTGHRPFSFETRARREIEKMILEQIPDKPSTMISKVETKHGSNQDDASVSALRSATLDRIRKQLSGDLDRIVLMALRKEIDRRYQSADQLLNDCKNYRLGLPVSAQADTWSYRASKFVLRNKLAVGASIVVALALIATTIVSARFAVVTANQRDEIALEARKAEEVKDLVLGLFERANPEYSRGREISVREMVDQSARSLPTELGSQPEVLSEMLTVLGLVYADLGEPEAGQPLVEQGFALRSSAGQEDSADLAQSFYAMGYILDEIGEWDQALDHHEQALAMRRRLFGEQSLPVAQSLNEVGVALYGPGGKTDSNLVVWNQAYEIRKTLLMPPHIDLVESLSNLGAVNTDLGEYAQAESYYRSALDMLSELSMEDGPAYASNLHNLGSALMELGTFTEAISKLEEAIALRSVIFGPRHQDTANSINFLGRVYLQMGSYSVAEQKFRESMQIHIDQLGGSHYIVGRDLHQLANLFITKGDVPSAIDFLDQAIAVYQVSDEISYRIWEATHQKGDLLMESGNAVAAAQTYRQSVDVGVALWGDMDPDVAEGRIHLAQALIGAGQGSDALPELALAEAWYQSEDGKDEEALESIAKLKLAAQND